MKRTVERGRAQVDRGSEWVEQSRPDMPMVDLSVLLYERSRESFLAVMGAALALRLFLFVVPAVVMCAGVLLVIVGKSGLHDALEQSSITGSIATQIDASVSPGRGTGFVVFFSGLFLSLWAGRNLAKVLAACAGGAWRIRNPKATIRMAGSVTILVLIALVTGSIINRLRTEYGVAASASSLIGAFAIYTVGWFFVSWTLPRGTRDASALLPGALLMGVVFTLLQWVMQFYLPGKIERSAEIMGTTAVAISALGYFFIVGRIMASTFVVNAVVYERFGSLSGFVFGLPGLRRIPGRFPKVAHHFGWDEHREHHHATTVDEMSVND